MRISTKAVLLWVMGSLASLLAVLGILFIPATAASVTSTPSQQASTPTPSVSQINAQCLLCHSRPNLSYQLPNGDSLFLSIDTVTYDDSIHGKASLDCVSCHTDITGYPHPSLDAQNLREVAIAYSQTCQSCHPAELSQQQESIHAQALARGNENAAVCSDCHNPHYTTKPAEPRPSIVAMCATCHSGIARQYSQSVHGTALIDKNNPDVPSCIDCHGVHDISNPLTSQFLLASPQLCAKCHTDQQKMAKYGLNTNVLNTYLNDFHGTTVALFNLQSPEQLPAEALCIDCHGIHDIKSVSDASSSVNEKNLLATCQQCHPNATTNFPSAWLHHYTPSPSHAPLVYYVTLFYKIFIPLVIGGMLLFVASDIVRRIIRKVHSKGGRH